MGNSDRAVPRRHPQSDEWLTPPEILAALGPFDLDPCAMAGQPWPTAARHYTKGDDGLSLPWGGRVWMNPPYSEVARWVRRLAEHGDGVALVFARTSNSWWQEHVFPRASALFFFGTYLRFHRPDGTRAPGNAGDASAMVAYGERNAEALSRCGLRGAFVRIHRRVARSPVA